MGTTLGYVEAIVVESTSEWALHSGMYRPFILLSPGKSIGFQNEFESNTFLTKVPCLTQQIELVGVYITCCCCCIVFELSEGREGG
jgi:hypothetical protein